MINGYEFDDWLIVFHGTRGATISMEDDQPKFTGFLSAYKAKESAKKRLKQSKLSVERLRAWLIAMGEDLDNVETDIDGSDRW